MLITNEITQMAKAIVTQLPILNGIANSDEHQQALILLEDLIENYDENLVIIEALSNVIARYEDDAAEFDDFNKRQTAYASNLSVYASINRGRLRWHLYQPHLGTQVHRCGCFLPDLTRLTVYRCEGTSRDTIKEAC